MTATDSNDRPLLRAAACLFALSLCGCGAAQEAAPPTERPAPPPVEVEPLAPAPQPTASAPTEPTPPPAAAMPPKAPEAPRGVFPPPAYSAPHERTAKPGDGAWEPMIPPQQGEPSALLRSVVHPHPIKGFAYVIVVAADLARLDLSLVAGTEEPASETVPAERRPGLVPAAEQPRLVAIFNGGFKGRHGNFGVKIGDDTFLPANETSCTVAGRADGGLTIASWPKLAPRAAEIAWFRQTPPCLLEGGVLHPELPQEEVSRVWGRSETKENEIRRSAVGLDKTGRTLFYGFGDWISASSLALAMKSAGAIDAAELDINWSYPRFFLMEPSGKDGQMRIASTFVPQIKYSRDRYTTKPEARDFFYLTRKAP